MFILHLLWHCIVAGSVEENDMLFCSEIMVAKNKLRGISRLSLNGRISVFQRAMEP